MPLVSNDRQSNFLVLDYLRTLSTNCAPYLDTDPMDVVTMGPWKWNMAQQLHRNTKSVPSARNLYAPAAVPRDLQLVTLLPIPIPVVGSILTVVVGSSSTAIPQNSPITTTSVASSISTTTANNPRSTLTGVIPATQPNSVGNSAKTMTTSEATSFSSSGAPTTAPTHVPSDINDINPINAISIGPGGVPILKAAPIHTAVPPSHSHLPDSQSSGSPGATIDSGTNWGGPKSPGLQPSTKAKYVAIAAVVVVLVLVMLCIAVFCLRRRHRKQPLSISRGSHWRFSTKPMTPTSEICNNEKPSTRSQSSLISFANPIEPATMEVANSQILPLSRLSNSSGMVFVCHQRDGPYSANNASTSSLRSASPCQSISTSPSCKEVGPVPSMESYLLSDQNVKSQSNTSYEFYLCGSSIYSLPPIPTTPPPVSSPNYNLMMGRNPFDDP